VQASFKRLTHRIFDYAGMFPPAQLNSSAALSEFNRLSEGPEGGLLNRFCCRPDRLGEVGSPKIPVSVIGAASTGLDAWYAAREADASLMTQWGDEIELAAYEVRSPLAGLPVDELGGLAGFASVDVFVEFELDDSLEDTVAGASDLPWMALKVRTGGQPSDLPPSPEHLARFLAQAVSLEVPFKLTGGLHEPLTKAGPEFKYGFVNVLAAAALAFAEDLPPDRLRALLLEQDPAAFQTNAESLVWHGFRADMQSIEEVRELFVSIGSCSIREPFDGLQDIGWI